MDEHAYWDKQHDKYLTTDWIDKPSLFAEWAMQHLPKTGSLLDLGAGQAQDSRYFASKGYSVTATDFSEHALELAKGKTSDAIQFAKVDLWQPLPFATETYDIVYAHLSLHYLDAAGTKQLLAEILRVLKPGGVLVALCNSKQDPEIAEGTAIEQDYIELEGIRKRYFDPESMRNFAKDFEIIITDDQGTTYKDEVKGIHNLIRLVARKV